MHYKNLCYYPYMTKEKLEAAQKAAKEEFDSLETQKQQIIQRQFELRGKFQTYEEQLTELRDPAKTVEPKEK